MPKTKNNVMTTPRHREITKPNDSAQAASAAGVPKYKYKLPDVK